MAAECCFFLFSCFCMRVLNLNYISFSGEGRQPSTSQGYLTDVNKLDSLFHSMVFNSFLMLFYVVSWKYFSKKMNFSIFFISERKPNIYSFFMIWSPLMNEYVDIVLILICRRVNIVTCYNYTTCTCWWCIYCQLSGQPLTAYG